MVNYSAPHSGPSADSRHSASSRPSDGFSSMPVAHSPTPTTGSASTTATEGKRKHGKFGFKSKDQDRPSNSHELAHQLSPLPPLTPVKAAQLLGVDPGPGRVRSTSVGRRVQNDGGYDILPLRPVPTRRGSMSSLTPQKSTSNRQTKFIEEGIEPDTPKSKGFWGNTNKKAQRMLGMLPSAAYSARREADMERVAAVSLAQRLQGNTDTYRSGEAELHGHSHPLLPVEPKLPEAPRRRMRKKIPKELEKMVPITETSHDELRSSYKSDEHNPELHAISEYARSPFKALPLRPHDLSLLTTGIRYELEEDELSPTDQVIEEEAEGEEEDFAAHHGNAVDVKKNARAQPMMYHLRGPLQTVEDRLLDEAEAQLAISKAAQNQNDADRLILDTQYAGLKASNEVMKAEFAAMQRRYVAPEECRRCDGADSQDDDDDDLISICSSIDLDEEPTVHVATAVPFIRVTPGMVKLVDIPPRRKKPDAPPAPPAPPTRAAPSVPPSPLPTLAPSSQMKAPFKPTYYYQHDERISPFNERSEHVEVRKYLSPTTNATNKIQPTEMRGPLSASEFNRLDKDKKAKIPRDDSRLLVQDWMSTYDHTKQRPISERIDLDVLADQQIPPAPFPKEDYTTRPHPPRSSSKEHYCVKNGHIFHPINLKTVPDEVAINSLEVRPYLHTAVGYKQHVSVPIFCDNCGENVKEELWQCDIPVCNMEVCKKCAEDMELEWQERVADAWTR
jgi:hypothetical protein